MDLEKPSSIEENRIPIPAQFVVDLKKITCQAPSAVKNKEKGLKGVLKLLDDLDTSPELKTMIVGGLRHAPNSTTPTSQSFGYTNFGGGITTRSIFEDQADIRWTNFLCGRWGVKWKEAQKRHYLRMNISF